MLCLGRDGPVESVKCSLYVCARNSICSSCWPPHSVAMTVQVWYKCDVHNLKESKGLSRRTIHAGSGSFKKKQKAVKLKSQVRSGNAVEALHLILPLLMTEILWQLVGIWQPAHLNQISMEHPLQTGYPCWKPPWKSLPEDRLQVQWLREVSCKQVGTLQVMCPVPVLTQPS